MPTPTNIDEFLDLVQKSGIIEERRLTAYLDRLRASSALPADPTQLADLMLRDGLLTHFQREQLLQGRWKRFTIGKYKVLERLGAGGMGSVYLCEHKLMRRRVAVKVLPAAKAEDPAALDRFYREARAVAALDHPNIVRAYDIDQDGNLHFLVMEYVDGSSMQDIVKKVSPLDLPRACNYIRQSALGLQHAHEAAALVHRDIKPGNILVDRNGIVKILDMGLARFFHDDEDELTKKYGEDVLGTADYLAPEQALDSHGVDIRADIYSLGATFYYALTGRTPFSEGTVAQKLIWHQTRQPKPIRSFRDDVPEEVLAIIDRMMAKDRNQRYGSPQEVVDALAVWTQTPVPPPPESEMPQLSPAALGITPGDPAASRSNSDLASRRGWQVNTSAASLPGSNATPPSGTPGPLSSTSQPRPLGAPIAKALSGLPQSTSGPLRQAKAPPTSGASSRTSKPASKANTGLTSRPKSPSPRRAEEEPNWESIAPDTDDPKAQANTAPLPRSAATKQRPVSTRSASKVKPAIELVRKNLRLWIVIGVSAFLVLSVLIICLLVSFLLGGKSEPGPSPASTTVPVRKALEVDADVAGAFPTLQKAIDNAKPQDRIVVKSSVRGTVHLKDKQNLIIETERDMLWQPLKPPPGAKPQPISQLLTIENCSEVTIRGFTLEGDEQGLDRCINIWGKCPGVVVDRMQLKNFNYCGILITNCEGTSEKPVLLTNLKFSPNPAQVGASGIFFDFRANLPNLKDNRWITIRDVEFPGEKGAIVKKKGIPFHDITVSIPFEER